MKFRKVLTRKAGGVEIRGHCDDTVSCDESSTDICLTTDEAGCIVLSYDYCTMYDSARCSYGATDWCDYDYKGCTLDPDPDVCPGYDW